MPENLIKPTPNGVKDEKELLNILVPMWELLVSLQNDTLKANIIILGAVTSDPGAPPAGKVYLYTISGSLYARTVTAAYLLAL